MRMTKGTGIAKLDLKEMIESTQYPDTAESQQDIVLTAPTRSFSAEENTRKSAESATSASPQTPRRGIVDDVVSEVGSAVSKGVTEVGSAVSKGVTGLVQVGEAAARAAMGTSMPVMLPRQSALIQGSLTVRVRYVPTDPSESQTPHLSVFTQFRHVHRVEPDCPQGWLDGAGNLMGYFLHCHSEFFHS